MRRNENMHYQNYTRYRTMNCDSDSVMAKVGNSRELGERRQVSFRWLG